MSARLARIVESLERRTLFAATDPVAAWLAQPGAEADLPRFLTPRESQRLTTGLTGATAAAAAPTAPPTGVIDPVAEYDAMEGLVISWRGSTAWLNNLIQIARRVTVEGNSRVYCGLIPGANQTSIANSFASAGVNMDNMTFFTVNLDSIWARDYGPRYVYEGDVRVITDHRYNRPTRVNDDNQPVVFGQFKQHQYYEIGLNGVTLVHGGGNYHLATDGDAYATQLIVNENPSFTAAQVQQIWSDYQANSVTLTSAFPASVDATQHIDMWMQIYGDKKAFISDWPNNPGSTQDVICDTTASLLQSRGYAVTRIPAYSIGGVHYTFANMVICNNVVILPQYNNGPGATVSSQVFAQVQAAFGAERTVFQLNADSIVTAAGVFHCIVQHVPAHRGAIGRFGGLAPTALLREPDDSPVYGGPGAQMNLKWITDDDGPVAATSGVQSVSLLLSTDGGQTFPTTIASGLSALGAFNWNIPAGIETSQARLRLVATDALGNTGFDDTDADLTIDTLAPSLAGSTFAFAVEQRLDLSLSEPATLNGATLTNLTTNEVLSGAQLQISANGDIVSIRRAGGLLLSDGNWQLTAPAGALTDAAGNASTAPLSVDFFVLAGDANRDRAVNIADFSVLAGRFNQPGAFADGDFNYSGAVEIGDFSILASRFNTSLPPALARAGGWSDRVAAVGRLASGAGPWTDAFGTRAVDLLEQPGGLPA